MQLISEQHVWFLQNETFFRPQNKISFHYKSPQKALYLIYGNKKVKQTMPSKNLIDISKLEKSTLTVTLNFSQKIEATLFVQLFTNEHLIESISYPLHTGENSLDIKEYHHSITHLKFLFRFFSQEHSEQEVSITSLQLLSKERSSPLSEKIKTKKQGNIVPNIPHHTINQEDTLLEGEQTYCITIEDTLFYFYLNYKKNDKLIISLPGATDRKKPFYNFQRYSWSHHINASFMSLLDPTIEKENELTIGWFQGTSNNYIFPKLIQMVQLLIQNNAIEEKNIIFFGSSAGGFSSLKLANHFPLSDIIVINPQIYLYHYSYNFYKKLIDYSFPKQDEEDVLSHYQERLEVTINLKKRKGSIYYYQNRADTHHMEKHLTPYLKTLQSYHFEAVDSGKHIQNDKKLYLFYYNDEKSGHTPPNKDKTLEFINNVVNQKIKKRFKWKF